jgi:hypothetical protein
MSFEEIIVVSGLPRSGTSMMMQILANSGMQLLVDDHRPSDIDNPHGYFELDKVKKLAQDNTWMGLARGKAIKVVSPLLRYLPVQWNYKIIFMDRSLDEVIDSQRLMLQHRQSNFDSSSDIDNLVLKDKFGAHLAKVKQHIQCQQNCEVLYVDYSAFVCCPIDQVQAIQVFLNWPLNLDTVTDIVSPALYRNRSRP